MILLYQLENLKTSNYARLKEQNVWQLKQLDLDKNRIIKKIKNSHILDTSGHYHIINNVLINNLNDYDNTNIDYDQPDYQLEKPNDLTLITQCSASRLYVFLIFLLFFDDSSDHNLNSSFFLIF